MDSIDNTKPKNLKKGETLSKVKNTITGDIFYASNLYEKYINGERYIGVFTKPDADRIRKVNWIKKDNLVKVKG